MSEDIEKQAARYRWLRNNRHLDLWWSMEGPAERCENIDADIDTAMSEDKDDYYEQIENWRLDAEELEAVHRCLDDHGVPREKDEKELSTWGRILSLFEPTKRR